MLKKKNTFDEAPIRYSLDAPFETVEAYNSLVSNLIRLASDEGYKSIAVTSASYGEGKAGVSINIAIALAQNLLSKKILLVDSDLRRSDVSSFMCPDAKSGLSDCFEENADEPAIIKSDIANLDLLSAGSLRSNPTGILRSDKMGSMLKTLEERYDYIIIDTSPVNDYADALFLADRVSGFIVATKRKVSSVSKIDVATSRIESSGAKILGFVFSE